MSSILDALNKLEEEKDRERQSSQPTTIDPALAAQELVSRDVLRDHMTFKISPMAAAVSGAVVVLLMVAIAVGVTVKVLGRSQPEVVAANGASAGIVEPIQVEVEEKVPIQVSSNPVLQRDESKPSVSAPDEIQIETVVEQKVVMDEPKLVPPPIKQASSQEEIVAPVKTSSSAEVVEQQSEPEEKPKGIQVAASAPMPVKIQTTPPPPPRYEAPERSRTVEPEPVIVEENIAAYPVFTRSLQSKYGLEKLRINMLKPKSERVPYPSAVINMVTVFEGETILNSSARLFKVEAHGIGIEIPRTGEQFYLKF